jgi:hypothetical protein
MTGVAAPEAAATDELDAGVDHLLQSSCEVARGLTGAHQAAIAMLVAGDWTQIRALRTVRALRLGEDAPPATVEARSSFVVIEPA